MTEYSVCSYQTKTPYSNFQYEFVSTGQGPVTRFLAFTSKPKKLNGDPFDTDEHWEVVIDFSVSMWGQRNIEEQELVDTHLNLVQAAASPESVD